MNINLMPQETVVQRYSFSIVSIAAGILVAATIVLLTLALLRENQARQSEALTGELNARIISVQDQMNGLQAQANLLQQLATEKASLGSQVDLRSFVLALEAKERPNMTLSSVSLSAGSVTLSGTTQTLSDLAQYDSQIRKLPVVSSVWDQGVTVNGNGSGASGYLFTLVITLSGTGGQHA